MNKIAQYTILRIDVKVNVRSSSMLQNIFNKTLDKTAFLHWKISNTHSYSIYSYHCIIEGEAITVNNNGAMSEIAVCI